MTTTDSPGFRFLQEIAADLSRGQVAFPTFSRATIKIRAAVNDPDVDIDHLAQLISSEPVLAARIIQMANSAALNPGGKPIGDVRSAVLRVGLTSVKSVAVAVAMEQLREETLVPAYLPHAESAWRHSVDVAAVSCVLARPLARINPDEALFAGLVHDIGHFYLLSQAAKYPRLEHHLSELEDILAEWHPAIGSAVLHEFQLSDAVLEAVAEHESMHYAFPLRSMPDLVTVANLICGATNPIAAYRDRSAAVSFQPEIVAAFRDGKAEIQALAKVLRC